MKSRYYLEGLLGLLSVLGFVGVFTEERSRAGVLRRYVPDRRGDAGRHFVGAARRAGAAVRHPVGLGGCGGGAVAVGGAVPLPGKLGRLMIRTRMKEYRARTGMKQEELAALVGVRRETIGNLENGKYNPSLVLAWRIARVFGVSIEDVFTVEE